MIKRISSEDELLVLTKSGIEAQKIRALFKSYGTDYDFCSFYKSDNFIITRFYDEFVICKYDEADNNILDELGEFLIFSGFSKILCAEDVGETLNDMLLLNCKKLNVMEFCGEYPKVCDNVTELSLTEAYDILKTSFEINYEPWYLDMSHRIRHGVSKLYGNDSSVLCVQHNLCGEALLSQIATIPEKRGQGKASELILSVCKTLCNSKVFLLCEDKHLSFYKRLGFIQSEFKCELSE